MAKGSHRRPDKGKKKSTKNLEDLKDMQRVKDRERESRRDKAWTRQMRGKRWDEEEYSDEFESDTSDI